MVLFVTEKKCKYATQKQFGVQKWWTQLLLFTNPVIRKDKQQLNDPRVWFAWLVFVVELSASFDEGQRCTNNHVLYHKQDKN